MFDESFLPTSPLPFFQIQAKCLYLNEEKTHQNIKKKEYLLPVLSKMTGEIPFAALHMGWNHSGLYLFCDVGVPFQDVFYPDFIRGDSLELFIDTRDVKTSGFNTRFCHHFFFLPKNVEEQQAGEITRFRSEDAHELCDPKDLKITASFHKTNYHLNIFIPSECLHGYDPDQFNRMGFSYRLNRFSGPPQHFSVLSDEFKLEQQPSLWSHLHLVHENPSLSKSS